MLRSNFFYRFFKHKKNTDFKALKYRTNKGLDLQDTLKNQIIEINKKISENSQSLIEAQIVKFRSNISQSNNFLEKIGENVYKLKLEDSINWHQKEIKDLYLKRRKLQVNLEKIQGTYWQNQIKRFLQLLCIVLFTLLSIFIFFSGFMIVIYLLPLIILIFLGYSLSTKKY